MGSDRRQLRISYLGCALSGRAMNLQYVFARTDPAARTAMQSSTEHDEYRMWFTLQARTFDADFTLATAHGARFHPRTRRELTETADGIVVVIDSQRARFEANVETLMQLREDLQARPAPIVLQFNKRDLPASEIFTVDELQARLNPEGWPHVEAIASRGEGVFDTLRRCAQLVMPAAS